MAAENTKTKEISREIGKAIESIERELVKLVIYVDKQNSKIEIYENDELVCELKLDKDCVHDIVEYIQYEIIDLYKYRILEILEKHDKYTVDTDVYYDSSTFSNTTYNYAIIDFYTSLKLENTELEKENCKIVVKDSNVDFANSILRLELLLYEHKEFANFEEFVVKVHRDIIKKLKEQINIYNEAKKNIKQLFEKEYKRVLRENKEVTISYTESCDVYTTYITYELENVAATFSYSSQLNKYKVKLYENKKVVYESELDKVFVEALEEYAKELLESLESKLYNKAVETAEKIREEIKRELKEKYGIEAWDCEDWEDWKELAIETKVDGENEAIAIITFAKQYEHKCTMCEIESVTYYLSEDAIKVYIDEELVKELTSN